MSAVVADAAVDVPVSDQRAYRMMSIDILRGLVIIVMALDHVRDYVMAGAIPDPLSDPSTGPLTIETRSLTPFFPPAFVFLDGTHVRLVALIKTDSGLAPSLM